MKRTLIVGLLVTTMVGAMTGVASADPKGDVFVVECDNGIPDGSITAPPNEAIWAPGMQIDGTGVYILNAVTYTAVFYPDDGGLVDLGIESFTKNAPRNTKSHRHGVCTFGGAEPFELPDFGTGTLVFTASASVFWTGK